ncbi:magnesium transporter [Leptothermofonsia sichuanensis E412]|uniref:magnesium transporter n=1 Tax=Leptothermofonsia sichuanensis TaxID=2917832 RepID=UPI001CA67DB4|nr:magnesium transporter [Leptothermofonsia sichuanensis]QZZ19275.1 magnesium transporter [Leptothermofonsia sichuanensis E412]
MTSQTDSRQEFQEQSRQQLKSLLEEKEFDAAKAMLIPMQPADIADVIEGLPEAMQAIAFRLLLKNEAIEVYEYLQPKVQQALLEDFKHPEVLEIVDQMSPDDRVRLFDELPAKVVRQLFLRLSSTERDATALLLGYAPGTAGRIMTSEFVTLRETLTVSQALEHIRRLANAAETIYTLYVVDDSRHLIGTLSLRNLVTASPDQTIQELMDRDVIFVYTNTDQEEVAQLIQHYDFLAVPVVDTEQRLVGIVTVDDVLDVIEEETTEDIYTAGGVQSVGDDYFQTNLLTVARKRVFWLLILLLTNTGTTAVIRNQEDILEQVVALAFFIPLLIDAGGNVGAQSSTVVIRGLNTNEVRLSKSFGIVGREALAGSLLGIMLGLVVTLWAYFLQRDWGVALSVGTSLVAISILASVAGAGLPFLFKAMKFDPALMSAPFITTAVDVLGVFIYLTVARAILQL